METELRLDNLADLTRLKCQRRRLKLGDHLPEWEPPQVATSVLTPGIGGKLHGQVFKGLSGIQPQQQSSLFQLGLWMALSGLGTGVFITPNSRALMGSAPRGQQGSAGSVLGLARTIGMMAGVSLGTALFRSLGGRTGHLWRQADLDALSTALVVGAAVSLLGAVAAALRGRGKH